MNEIKKVELKAKGDNDRLDTMSLVVGSWMAILTLAMVIVLAVIWKRMRTPKKGHSMTTLNDSESAFADSVYNKSSVVDFDGPFKGGKWMSGLETTTTYNIDKTEQPEVHEKR